MFCPRNKTLERETGVFILIKYLVCFCLQWLYMLWYRFSFATQNNDYPK